MNTNIMNSSILPDFTILTQDECISLLQKYSNNFIISENINVIEELKKIWKNKLYHNLECTICLEELKNGDNLITECGHYYHSSCIFNYITSLIKNGRLSEDNSVIKCPKCKKSLAGYDNEENEENEDNDSRESHNTSISSESSNDLFSDESNTDFTLFTNTDENGNIVEYTIQHNSFDDIIDIRTGEWR